jgi:hypothetical protein
MTYLYVNSTGPGTGGYWRCMYPNGSTAEVRAVSDFYTTGIALQVHVNWQRTMWQVITLS